MWAALVSAETIMSWSWQNVLVGSIVVKLIPNLGRRFIVTMSPINAQDVEDEDITTFLESVVVVILVGE